MSLAKTRRLASKVSRAILISSLLLPKALSGVAQMQPTVDLYVGYPLNVDRHAVGRVGPTNANVDIFIFVNAILSMDSIGIRMRQPPLSA